MTLSRRTWLAGLVAGALSLFSCVPAWSYPGGPLRDVTDAAPYCAGCHSSVDLDQLRDLAPQEARKQTAAVAHTGAIKAGSGPYGKLSPEQRDKLIADVEKVEQNSNVALQSAQSLKVGQKFSATVTVRGGSGPVFGIMLLDTNLRSQAREIQGAGFLIAAPPQVVGPDGQPQDQWLRRRYERLSQNINFVVVFGVKTDLAADRFSSAKVTYEMIAPRKPGKYTICAGFLYGTEKASALGRVDVHGRAMPLGGFDGASGRIQFSEVKTIEVR